MFLAEDFSFLMEAVDYFSLMTYDYSNPARPGPNSPLPWAKRSFAFVSKLRGRTMIFVLLSLKLIIFDKENDALQNNKLESDWVDQLMDCVYMFTIFRCVELLDPDRLNRKKILMGLNFYGFDYTSQGGGHVLGRDLIKVCMYKTKISCLCFKRCLLAHFWCLHFAIHRVKVFIL